MSAEERLLKALESPKTQDALVEIVERIDVIRDLVRTLWEFKRSGVLDDLLQLATTVRFVTEGLLTPGFMENMAKLQEVAITAAINLSQDTSKLDCLTTAVAVAEVEKPIGLMGLLAALRDPDVQRGLGYLVSLLKQLGKCMEKRY